MGIKTQIKAKELESSNQFNISLLGFKMAITEGLTIFNLVDGIVDEFEDESGVDNSASTSLNYNSTDDFYVNANPLDYSAGFSRASGITEPDTSVYGGTNANNTFTVPTAITSLTLYAWGSGGGTSNHPNLWAGGGGGGFSSGVLAVTPGQTLNVTVGGGGNNATEGLEGGYGGLHPQQNSYPGSKGGGDGSPTTPGAGGGGLSGIGNANLSAPGISAPQVFLISGSGGGGATHPYDLGMYGRGGSGGGLIGFRAGPTLTAATAAACYHGGGGSQSAGGQGAANYPATDGQTGGFLYGGNAGTAGGGGAGYYGGGGGEQYAPADGGGGGGGSSYYGHPQITSGATTAGGASDATGNGPGPFPMPSAVGEGGGVSSPLYVAGTNEGSMTRDTDGEDGYVLITANNPVGPVASSTIISDPFTANTVPTNSRIIIFEENVDTPTLNTDVIASVSRNNGSNFTTVTLTDTGYVTGSSGQRILTGQADISGQPSGQSMKWKLQLANQTVKIHGVSLQWS